MTLNSTSGSGSSIASESARQYRDRKFSEQDSRELDQFIGVMMSEGIRSYLEIGSNWGATFWIVATALPPGSRAVSVDIAANRDPERSLFNCVDELGSRGYDAHLIRGDSTARETVDAVKNLAPFDAAFIDANHTLQYVRRDFENYAPLARVVAFHDIAFVDRGNRGNKLPIEVSRLWGWLKLEAAVRPGWRFQEISHCDGKKGIGLLWTR